MLFKKPQITLIFFLFFIIGSLEVCAQTKRDVKGSKDHPMISRYKGSFIYLYEKSDYNLIEIPWKMEDRNVQDTTLEGEITHIFYAAPKGLSAFQVHKNYQMALKDAGFEIVYECTGGKDKCGRLFRDFNTIDDKNEIFIGEDNCYLVAMLDDPAGKVLVTARTLLHTHYNELKQRPVTELQVVEEKNMETGMVNVSLNAEAMRENIEKSGKVRIYGIHFDTNKAKIKNDSQTTLSEIASLLNDKSDLHLYIVGHTDATGSFDHNMELSEERANAVTNYLINKEGIDSKRLEPYGVGCLAPVASNSEKNGRARNRRVELVKRMKDK